MRGRTWLGAALVLGAQLRGKESWPRFPPLIPKLSPAQRLFPRSWCDSFRVGLAGRGTERLSFFPNRFGRIRAKITDLH